MRFSILLSFLAIGMLALSSCQKENIDDLDIKEDENTPDSVAVNCDDLSLVFDFNPANNSLTVVPDGGTPPYSYEWSTGETTESIQVNASGVYSVTITDSEACEGTAEYTYTSDPCALFVGIDFNYDLNNDELTASPLGGEAPFMYQWSTGDLGPTITTIPGSTYSVTITDSNGCALEAEYVPNSGPCMDAEIQYNPANASLTAVAMGAAPYIYMWSTGENTQSISPVNPGDEYWVIISDAGDCVVVVLFEW